MKIFMAFSTMLISLNTLACPDFSGDYRDAQDQGITQRITQTANEIQFGEGALPVILDGAEHTSEGEGGLKVSVKATCDANSMTIDMSAVLPTGENLKGKKTYIKTEAGHDEISTGFEEGTVSWIKLN